MKKVFYILSLLLICQLGLAQTKVKSLIIENRPPILNDTTQIDILVRQNEGAALGNVKRVTWPYFNNIIGTNFVKKAGETGQTIEGLIRADQLEVVNSSTGENTRMTPYALQANTTGQHAELSALGGLNMQNVSGSNSTTIKTQVVPGSSNTLLLPVVNGVLATEGFVNGLDVNSVKKTGATNQAIDGGIIINGLLSSNKTTMDGSSIITTNTTAATSTLTPTFLQFTDVTGGGFAVRLKPTLPISGTPQISLPSVTGTLANIAQTITNGVTTSSPSQDAVFDALENKADLDGSDKILLSQIPDVLLGAVNYQGTYNAATNTPTLPTATGNKGFYYVVNVAGTVSGTAYAVGDWIISNGSTWDKVTQTFPVDSSVVDGSNNAVSGNAVYDALATKANTNGSNATGTWPISVSGTAARANTVVTSAGDATFHWADGIGAGVSPQWIWGGTNPTDAYVFAPNSITGYATNVLHTTSDESFTGVKSVANGGINFINSSGYMSWPNNFILRHDPTLGGLNLLHSGVTDGVFFIKDDRNIGINTTNPLFTLDVAGTSRFTGVSRFDNNLNIIGNSYIGFNSNTWTVNHGSGGMNFTKQGTGNALFLKDDLKVGVNTSTPTSNLHVIGSQRVEGPVVIGTGTVNGLETRMSLYNSIGKTWAFSSGTPGVDETSLSIINVTDNTTPFYMSSTGNVALGYISGAAKLSVYNGPGGSQFEAVRGSGRALFGQELNVHGLLLYSGAAGSEVLNQRWYGSGNTTIGSSTDNGYKLEVTGTANVTGTLKAQTAPVANEDVVRKLELDTKQSTLVSGTNIKTVNGNSLLGSGDVTIDARPYKCLTVLLNQSSTNPPTPTVLENTVIGGGSINTSYVGVGFYRITCPGGFTNNKTHIVYAINKTISAGNDYRLECVRLDSDNINIYTYYNGTLTNGLLSNSSLEIKVYN